MNNVQPIVINRNDQPLSTSAFVGSMLLCCIPIIGFILLLVWSFSSGINANKRNWARAILIVQLIWFALGIVLSIAFSSVIGILLSQIPMYF